MYDVPMAVSKEQTASLTSTATPDNGTLLPPVTKPLHRGGKLISFDIEKWGFKDEVIKVNTLIHWLCVQLNPNLFTVVKCAAHTEPIV